MSECVFCPLERKTEWFRETPDGIKAVLDLNNKGYKYRILVVGSGTKFHRSFVEYSEEEIQRFTCLGLRLAGEHIKQGRAEEVAEVDTRKHKYPGHFHVQICMR